MGFTVTQPFDSLDAEESRNQKRGAERVGSGNCCGVVTTRSQSRDLHFDRVAGIIPVCLG